MDSPKEDESQGLTKKRTYCSIENRRSPRVLIPSSASTLHHNSYLERQQILITQDLPWFSVEKHFGNKREKGTIDGL